MNPIEIIERHYEPDSKAYHFLVHHGKVVAQKALFLAQKVRHLNPDIKFIEEASLLHDMGIIFTNAPKIGCFGFKAYICHGYLGRELLEREGLPRHALVCERHVGVGISVDDIRNNNLPLPLRDMVPESIEEKIVCLADKFFSKAEHDAWSAAGCALWPPSSFRSAGSSLKLIMPSTKESRSTMA